MSISRWILLHMHPQGGSDTYNNPHPRAAAWEGLEPILWRKTLLGTINPQSLIIIDIPPFTLFENTLFNELNHTIEFLFFILLLNIFCLKWKDWWAGGNPCALLWYILWHASTQYNNQYDTLLLYSLAAPRWRCINFIYASCNIKFSIWSCEEKISNFAVSWN